jgi:hypothetical protein
MTIDDEEPYIDPRGEAEVPVREVARAIDDLPILARLEMARNLLVVNGGSKDALELKPALVLVHDIICDVIRVLDKRPRVAKLRTPNPKLG